MGLVGVAGMLASPAAANSNSDPTGRWPVFDSHFHIIDPRFPLVPNEGYLPKAFTIKDYQERMASYKLRGGAVVSASFQAFDQSYLVEALTALGPAYVGVTQLPAQTSDSELQRLAVAGVRGLRFNLKRGGPEDLRSLDSMARRVHEVSGWSIELYVDSRDLDGKFVKILGALPRVCIDHLGLSQAGFPALLRLAEKGVRVKATGFGRLDFAVAPALRDIHHANPRALMFGTDLPSTRAARPYSDKDFQLISETLGDAARAVYWDNAAKFYELDTRDPAIHQETV
jgi:predicted TIM-barrel fold metal-dependent hydrolase